MKTVILDSGTLGDDIDTASFFEGLGELQVYYMTDKEDVPARIADADIVITNKIKLGAAQLGAAPRLRLICVTATGYDNIDISECARRGIAVANVEAYSTASVTQVTMAIALSLSVHTMEYDAYVRSGAYTKSRRHNCLTPVFHELSGLTWGIAGFGNIGRSVARAAEALGCDILVCRRTPDMSGRCVGIDELCARSDIISIHTPLTEETRRMFDRRRLSLMKNTALLINMARGAVVDEEAVADAVLNGDIAGFGTDVYETEPVSEDSPFNRLTDCDNVIFTPHMAWGAYEARVRCMEEIRKNIDAFLAGVQRNRVEKIV